MAYIPYQYPFYDKKGQVTKHAKFFRCLVVISFIGGGYIIYDTVRSKSANDVAQRGLKDTIQNINANVISLKKNIDSIGYKIDHKTGLLVPKNGNAKTKAIPRSFEKSLTDAEANNILKKIRDLQKKYSIKNNRILFYVSESSNQRKLSYQLKTILEKKTFTVDVGSSGETFEGIRISADSGFFPHQYVIEILVGTSL